MFLNRIQAGKLLAQKLKEYKNQNAVIMAIPRGGLPVGASISKALNLPLEIVLVKKIGHPHNKEYAVGAVSLEDIILDKQAPEIPMSYIIKETEKLRASLKQRKEQYYINRKPLDIKDKIVIIVDDGVATGNTILATAQIVQEDSPSKIIVAVPVAPISTILKLESSLYINEVICLEQPIHFNGVGGFYENFDQVSDEEAINFFEESNNIKTL